MNWRWAIMKKLNSIQNQVQRWLHIYFPEFNSVFASREGKAALACLRHFPTSALVMETGIDGIVACWRKEGIRNVGIKRATQLYEAARQSIGIRQGLEVARENLDCLLDEYSFYRAKEEKTMAVVERLVLQVPASKRLLGIKGVGLITVAGFLAEVGDISRFSSPKQIQKYAGLNLKENSSGQRPDHHKQAWKTQSACPIVSCPTASCGTQ